MFDGKIVTAAGRVGGHRHGAERSRRGSRATRSRRRSSSGSSTTRSRRSTPARPPRHPPRSSLRCARARVSPDRSTVRHERPSAAARGRPAGPLTSEARWPSIATTPTRSSLAGRRCGRASAPGRSSNEAGSGRSGERRQGDGLPRTGKQLLRARDAPLSERGAAHRSPEGLLGRRRDRALPPPARPPRAAPDGL